MDGDRRLSLIPSGPFWGFFGLMDFSTKKKTHRGWRIFLFPVWWNVKIFDDFHSFVISRNHSWWWEYGNTYYLSCKGQALMVAIATSTCSLGWWLSTWKFHPFFPLSGWIRFLNAKKRWCSFSFQCCIKFKGIKLTPAFLQLLGYHGGAVV